MKRSKKMVGVAALVVDLTLMMSGCISGVVDLGDDFDHSGKAEATAAFEKTVELGDQTGIRIEGANGTIRVWGVAGLETVEVAAIRRVRSDSHYDAADHLADLQVLVQHSPHELLIKTVQPHESYGRTYIVDYEISVPDHLLQDINNGNGSIRLEGIAADVEVRNGNGDVILEDVVGSSRVTLGNGKLSANTYLPAGGQIVHSVGNGSISLNGLDLQGVVSTPRELKGTLGDGSGLIQLALGNGQIRVEGG